MMSYSPPHCFHVGLLLFVCLFRAALAAYGSSQARGQIRTTATTYTTPTATWDVDCVCDLHHSSQQRWILNTLSEARDQTWVLMDTSRVCYPLSHSGNPQAGVFEIEKVVKLSQPVNLFPIYVIVRWMFPFLLLIYNLVYLQHAYIFLFFFLYLLSPIKY